MLEKDLLEFSENINALREFVDIVEVFFLQKKMEDQITHELGFGVLEAIRDADHAAKEIGKKKSFKKSPQMLFFKCTLGRVRNFKENLRTY